VRLFELALLADDNIHPDVIRILGSRATDVASTAQLGLAGASDASILARAWPSVASS
jgi:predicted nuclease of predicted toxin-antitoxin system